MFDQKGKSVLPPVIASPCEIKDTAYGRMEGKVYSPQNNARPTAVLYFTGAWQSHIHQAMTIKRLISKIPINGGKFKPNTY